MKKQLRSKLSLSKETLRNLSERELSGAVGGFTGAACCNSCTDWSDCSCPSEPCTANSNCC